MESPTLGVVRRPRRGAPLDSSCLRAWFDLAAAGLREEREHLTLLDAAIGDADHGANMDRGFHAVRLVLAGDDRDEPTSGALLRTASSTLMSTVGGASGALWGTAVGRAAEALGDAREFDAATLGLALQAALDGIVELGAARVGDKTMVDALAPVVSVVRASAAAGAGAEEAVRVALRAGEAGMRSTVPLQAAKGRASYLGDRSVGHQDPGATSTMLIVRGLAGALSTAER
jgi:phosphoenolpyruvate---glycerone phosphotransferase subunit DhaL